MLRLLSRFLRALFQFSKRAAGEATKFGRSGVKLLGVVGAARLECGKTSGGIGRVDPAVAWQQLRRFLRLSWGAVDQFKFVVLGFR